MELISIGFGTLGRNIVNTRYIFCHRLQLLVYNTGIMPGLGITGEKLQGNLTDDDGDGNADVLLQLGNEPGELFRIRISQSCAGIVLSLVPENCREGAGSHGLFGTENRMLIQHTAFCPFIHSGAAVGTGDQGGFFLRMILNVVPGKTGGKAGSGEGTVIVDWFTQGLPFTVSLHQQSGIADGIHFIEPTAAGHVGLTDHQKRSDHKNAPSFVFKMNTNASVYLTDSRRINWGSSSSWTCLRAGVCIWV